MSSGIVSGADHPMFLSLNLQVCGLMGEAHMGQEDNVMIIKTHHPCKNDFDTPFKANKMFLLMRNPLDAIPSHVTLVNTTSHSMSLKGQTYHETFPDYWAWIQKREVNFMKNFFERNRATSCQAIPTYYVRYEDLLIDPRTVLTELFCFLLDVTSLEGTVLEAQIARHTADLDSKAVYKLKNKTRSLCRSAHMYTEE